MAEAFKPIGAAAVNVVTRLAEYPRIVTPVANHLARKEIERQWRARGLRIQRYATIIAEAQSYLLEHPELFEQALERVRKSPWHSMMAEREERERRRVERKLEREQRKLVVGDDLPVSPTDQRKSPTENTSEFVQPKGDLRGC
jgi:hypothetical protein